MGSHEREDHLGAWLAAYVQADPRMLADAPSENHAAEAEFLQRFERAQSCLAALTGLSPHGQHAQATLTATEPDEETLDGLPGFLPPKQLGRFRILSELGRGGYGIVYRALDPVLGRVVALKVPRPDTLVSSQPRERFLREARAMATLNHPNLVTVYEGGSVGPVCYIASAHCAGPTLAAWQKQQDAPVSPQRAAQLVAVLAEAIHYVHSRGIVHRDLKPGNVLLEPPGEDASSSEDRSDHVLGFTPKVADFGLAKLLGNQIDRTRTGAVLGTPSYMAPEQAEGRLEDVGPATDVYALGAILYELLTGQAPFREETELETLRQVVAGSLVPPGRLRNDLPRDLEAVCLKCLEFDAARRYARAGDLSAELKRFLQGEPVCARRAGTARRAAKWCRRKPLVASLTLALTVAVLVGFAAVTWQWRRAEMHRRRSDASFRQAHQAVREFHAILDEGRFISPQFNPVRVAIIETALKYYGQLLENDADDPALRADAAEAYYRAAFIYAETGFQVEALGTYQRSLRLWEALVEEDPQEGDYRYYLARVHCCIGVLHDRADRENEAMRSFQEMRGVCEELVRQFPDQGGYQDVLADSYHYLAGIYRRTGHAEEAMHLLQQAMRIRRRLAGEKPDYSWHLAETCLELGNLYRSTHHLDEALDLYQQAGEILEELVGQNLCMPWSAGDLATAHRVQGMVNLEAGRDREALDSFQEASAIYQKLVQDYPMVSKFPGGLAACHVRMAGLHRAGDRPDEELHHRQQACELYEQLVLANPTDAGFQRRAAAASSSLGRLHENQGRTRDALAAYEQARDHQRVILDNSADPQQHRNTLEAYCTAVTRVKRELDRGAAESVKASPHQSRMVRRDAP